MAVGFCFLLDGQDARLEIASAVLAPKFDGNVFAFSSVTAHYETTFFSLSVLFPIREHVVMEGCSGIQCRRSSWVEFVRWEWIFRSLAKKVRWIKIGRLIYMIFFKRLQMFRSVGAARTRAMVVCGSVLYVLARWAGGRFVTDTSLQGRGRLRFAGGNVRMG